MPELKMRAEIQALVPKLTEQEFDNLKESIKENGQYLPIVADPEGYILDGHNRYQACIALGLEPKYVLEPHGDLLQEEKYAITSNLHRRQLNDYQKAELAQPLLNIERELAKRREIEGVAPIGATGKASELVAKQAGLSSRTFERATKVIEKGTDEQKEKLRNGTAEIGHIYGEIRRDERKAELIQLGNQVAVLDRIQLIHKDFKFADEIKAGTVGMIFTDPPYGREFLPLYEQLGSFASRVLKEGSFLVCYAGHHVLPEVLFTLRKHLDFFWIGGVAHTQGFPQMHSQKINVAWKPLLIFTKGPPREHDWFNDLIKGDIGDKAAHDWAEGVEEAAYFISKLTQPEELVIDPMVGSGSTMLAAKKLGRNGIGIDIDEEALTIAKGRLSE